MRSAALLQLFAAAAILPQCFAQESEEVKENIAAQGDPSTAQSPSLKVELSTTFPSAEIFGVKLVNGKQTTAQLSFTNNEQSPVTLRFIGGTLHAAPTSGQASYLLRNLTTTAINGVIPVGESQTFDYQIVTNMHPQDVRLNIVAILTDDSQAVYPVSAFNETVSIVEAPTSILDPQILFLYLVLAGVFAGTAYFIYSTWISTLFPQAKKRGSGKGGERAKASSKGSKKVNPSDQTSVVDADGPAVTSGAKSYDESWIPQSHLKKPEGRRSRSNTPSGARTKKA